MRAFYRIRWHYLKYIILQTMSRISWWRKKFRFDFTFVFLLLLIWHCRNFFIGEGILFQSRLLWTFVYTGKQQYPLTNTSDNVQKRVYRIVLSDLRSILQKCVYRIRWHYLKYIILQTMPRISLWRKKFCFDFTFVFLILLIWPRRNFFIGERILFQSRVL